MKNLISIAVAGFLVTAFSVQAKENPIIDTVESAKDFVINNQVTTFVVNEYNDVKKLQQESWQNGKDQLIQNKNQVIGIFANVKGAFTHYFGNTEQ